jgi:hypothetical protein
MSLVTTFGREGCPQRPRHSAGCARPADAHRVAIKWARPTAHPHDRRGVHRASVFDLPVRSPPV